MKQLRWSFVILSLVFSASFAQGKDLTSRLGVGYRDALVTMELPSVAAFYYPSPDIGLIGSLGVDTAENNSKFAAAAALRRIIFKEDNMNFFGSGQLALVNREVLTLAGTTSKDSGFELAATVGGEFFLPGLESLGFNFETGMGITTVTKTRFRTLGASFLNFGMAFYF